MNGFSCEQCTAPMAPMEAACHSCGAPAPAFRRGQVMRQKAQAYFDSGRLAEAARELSRALEAGLPEGEASVEWRKLGIWQEKLGLPAPAEASFRKAREMGDFDENAHQLWQASLARLGRLSEATAYYKARLEKDPQDAVAARQLKIAAISADFLSNPKALAAPPPVPATRMERFFTPTRRKLQLSMAAALLCLAAGTYFSFAPAPEAEELEMPFPGDPVEGMTPLPSPGVVLADPWMWWLNGAFAGSYLLLLLKNRG